MMLQENNSFLINHRRMIKAYVIDHHDKGEQRVIKQRHKLQSQAFNLYSERRRNQFSSRK